MSDLSTSSRIGASVVLAGLGNIGSQTVALLPGIPHLRRVVLVDPDHYEAPNLGWQRIEPADVGRRKVDVQARSLRRRAPQLVVQTHACTVESLALGILRGCVILACVDSRVARQSINGLAVALGKPWIDAAIDRDGQVRSRVYVPGGDCLECSWGPRDYELIEQRLPCAAGRDATAVPGVAATAAPQELGALAAGLQVSHLRRLLAGEGQGTGSAGQQWFFDARSGCGWVGSYESNPQCRLDHQPWQITDLECSASRMPLSEALRLAGDDGSDSALSLHGQVFVRHLRCARCGVSRRSAPRVYGRLRSRTCRRCGGAMTASAADATDLLSARSVPRGYIDAPLSAFGLVDSDVFTLRRADANQHFQLAGAHEGAC